MFRSQEFSLTTTRRLVLIAGLVLMTLTLVSLPAVAQKATPTYLTSDITFVGNNTDANLVNPWGIAWLPGGPWWVADNGTGLSTVYNGSGTPQSLVVSILKEDGTPGGVPTGIVANGTSDFQISGASTHFLFDTEDGTIQGWSSGTSAAIAVNNSSSGAVYKGLALGSAAGANYLYAANFHAGTVDVYDKSFSPHSFGSGAFTDPSIPSGFAPFNVANIGNGKLVVTYAKQDADKHDDVPGPGNGYVDIYDTSGNLLGNLVHTPYSNSPWGVAIAPASGFGGFGGDFLVGQFGSGAIVAYTPAGKFVGLLFNPASLQLQINGLWGIGFGNGMSSGPTTTLYFAAGYFDEAHGIFGSITCCSTGPLQATTRIIRK